MPLKTRRFVDRTKPSRVPPRQGGGDIVIRPPKNPDFPLPGSRPKPKPPKSEKPPQRVMPMGSAKPKMPMMPSRIPPRAVEAMRNAMAMADKYRQSKVK